MKHKEAALLPFAGVDGEGSEVDGRHEYLHLRAGEHLLITGKPLTYKEVFPFLADLPGNTNYVGYFLDYDWSMVLRTLPHDVQAWLLNRPARERERGGCDPVQFDGWEFDYMPGKEFRVRRFVDDYRWSKRQQWRVFNDCGSFFQMSFVKALETWEVGTPEQLATIKVGKANRDSFDALAPETVAYNKLECELLVQLMDKFRDVLIDLKCVPSRWQGPGQVAAALFEREGIQKHDKIDTVPHGVWVMGQSAYIGGRFEAFAFGPVLGPIVQRDINSAYPWACTMLPCLVHGTWRQTTAPRKTGVYIGQYRFSHSRKSVVCNLPVRTKNGSITWPLRGRGWYWSCEVEAAQRAGTEVTLIGKAWEYVPQCDCVPFQFNPPMYNQRKALGKTGKGLALKLALNAEYGKMCQSIGAAPYANPVWGSMITALCRARLIDDYTRIGPQYLVMLATDGAFYTHEPDGFDVGAGLGQWEETISDDIFVVQPGLYFLDGKPPKTRGVAQMAIAARESELRAMWDARVHEPVGCDVRLFTGVRLANARHKPDTAGTWVDDTKAVAFNWGTKRVEGFMFNPDGRGWRTLPLVGGSDSIPYSKMIGKLVSPAELDGIEADEQPDGGY